MKQHLFKGICGIEMQGDGPQTTQVRRVFICSRVIEEQSAKDRRCRDERRWRGRVRRAVQMAVHLRQREFIVVAREGGGIFFTEAKEKCKLTKKKQVFKNSFDGLSAALQSLGRKSAGVGTYT